MIDRRGDMLTQTLAMPAYTNANGDIFGGWLVSQMDLAAGIMAQKLSKGRAVTVAIHSMTFLLPVRVGDLVTCHVELVSIGKTSMTIVVEVWKEDLASGEASRVTEGTFVFVAIDEQGRPRMVSKSI